MNKTYVTRRLKGGDTPTITISTAALDRDNDQVDPLGGQFDSYYRNPVVLFAHDYSALPVGRCISLNADANGIKAAWQWLENDPVAARVKNAFDQGVLNAASVGFRPITTQPNRSGGTRFTSWELLEWSLVPVPANAGAVRTLKRLGLWDDDVIDVDPRMLAEVMADVIGTTVRDQIAHVVQRETTNTITRMRGRIVDDPPSDPSSNYWSKSGRVLSQANEDRVRRAQAAARQADRHLEDVLSSMKPDDIVLDINEE